MTKKRRTMTAERHKWLQRDRVVFLFQSSCIICSFASLLVWLWGPCLCQEAHCFIVCPCRWGFFKTGHRGLKTLNSVVQKTESHHVSTQTNVYQTTSPWSLYTQGRERAEKSEIFHVGQFFLESACLLQLLYRTPFGLKRSFSLVVFFCG